MPESRSKAANKRRAKGMGASHTDPLPRIDTLIRTARTNWFGLMAYLAFVGVTLMGVEDADFFLIERQTELPLIGVNVPTALFFYIAPLLGALLHVHLHLYLLKLWKAIKDAGDTHAGQPLADATSPWLVVDMALSHRKDAQHPYPMRRVAWFAALILVFIGSPTVLGFFWWRSMPKHDLLLTAVFCGLPFFAVLYTSGSSFIAMRFQSTAARSFRRALISASAWSLVFLAIGFLGWARSDGTLRPFSEEEMFTDLLASANLAGVDFVNTPPDWLDYDDAQRMYRRQWCENRNINEFACGAGSLDRDAEVTAYLSDQRRFWCRDHFDPGASTATCSALWASLEDTYATDWQRRRNHQRTALRARDFAGIDLRRANLSEASLIGADLRGARMEGANLFQARMEGAVLFQARMEGANLRQARMEGANLSEARMEGAYLKWARMEGANLRQARMEGANLWLARMDASTALNLATFDGAALRGVDYSRVQISAEQVNASFGDASVILSETLRPAPGHWLTWEPEYWSLDETAVTFLSEWQRWRDTPEGEVFIPAPPPETTP